MQTIIDKIKNIPSEITFQELVSFIDSKYDFTPTKFKNGDFVNEAGQNSGSCKVFSFAHLFNFSKEETLNCFGDYHKIDVLQNPEGADHQNIRNFIKYGWEGIQFSGRALLLR